MSKDELLAKKLAIKETTYCYVLAQAWTGEPFNSECLERIFVKDRQAEEIRLALWKNGKQMMRPCDVDAVQWSKLFCKAIDQGVFSGTSQYFMMKHLCYKWLAMLNRA